MILKTKGPAMTLQFLGCGSSHGVPSICGFWGQCDPHQPKNRRSRSGLVFYRGKTPWLIDVPPDIRASCLAYEIQDIGGVLSTHGHFDHIGGLEDLRAFGQDNPVPFYADAKTLEALRDRCGYVFGSAPYRAFLVGQEIQGPFQVSGVSVLPFDQDHGYSSTLGFRFPSWAYSTDWVHLDEKAVMCLQDLDLWILGCVGLSKNPTHLNLERALEWIGRVSLKHAILTHMRPELDYNQLVSLLPPHVQVAYDGMKITLLR